MLYVECCNNKAFLLAMHATVYKKMQLFKANEWVLIYPIMKFCLDYVTLLLFFLPDFLDGCGAAVTG